MTGKFFIQNSSNFESNLREIFQFNTLNLEGNDESKGVKIPYLLALFLKLLKVRKTRSPFGVAVRNRFWDQFVKKRY